MSADFRRRLSGSAGVADGSRRGRAHEGLAGDLERLRDLGEVAGNGMPLPTIDQLRHLLRADRLRLPAARAEPATRRGIRRARNVALEDDPLALATLRGLFDRHCGEQGLRVRMR